ncbi:hypothetical protein KHA80_20785 [Anaerobacillus sp. HL2]|nr:hypothetical protein KHA80_20785 [Anaerobacillus sp. HL2]
MLTHGLRIRSLDQIILDKLDKAILVDPLDPLINEVYIKIYYKLLESPIFPKQFPQIRENDHGNAKRN